MITVEFTGIKQVIENLVRYEVEQRARLRLACEAVAQMLEQHARYNHPWHFDTWQTDLTTRGSWDELPGAIYQVVLSAGMDYNKYLELAGDGRYAANLAGLPHTSLTNMGSSKWSWLWPAMIEKHQAALSIFEFYLKH